MLTNTITERIKSALLALLLVLLTAATSLSATYHVSTTGSDSNPGTLNAPWKTIGKANSTLKAGDTVYIRKGVYNQTIRPSNSGSKGNYITYARYGSEEVTITGVFDGADLRNRSYVVLDGLRIINVKNYWVNMYGGSTHNIIMNCYMRGANAWGGVYMRDGANYNKVLNNIFVSACDGESVGPKDSILCWASQYNLFEGNDFRYAVHMLINFESQGVKPGYHVVRNNKFSNPWHSSIGVWRSTDNVLVEGNTILDSGEEHSSNMCASQADRDKPRKQHAGIQVGSSNLIIRNNVLINNGKLGMVTYEADKISYNNRLYNNSFYKNARGIDSNSYGGPEGNIFKNNIIKDSFEYNVIHGADYSEVRYLNNNIYGGTVKFNGTGNAYNWDMNTSIDPKFIDENNRDLRLQTTSPMIDKGEFLTKTTSSGNGTIIPVQDASYFMDGWGIVEGDLIQLEKQSQPVRILAIENNNIEVDRSISWLNGDGVSLPYAGSAPDIGAFESSNATVPAPPKNLTIKSQQ